MTRSTSYTAMLLLIALGLPAVAAENSEQGKSERIEEIVVTGIRIKRLDYFPASPLHTLDRATLEAKWIDNDKDRDAVERAFSAPTACAKVGATETVTALEP